MSGLQTARAMPGMRLIDGLEQLVESLDRRKPAPACHRKPLMSTQTISEPLANREMDEADTLRFRGSAGPTLGIELEFQIVDSQTGDLAPGAVRILKACQEEGLK